MVTKKTLCFELAFDNKTLYLKIKLNVAFSFLLISHSIFGGHFKLLVMAHPAVKVYRYKLNFFYLYLLSLCNATGYRYLLSKEIPYLLPLKCFGSPNSDFSEVFLNLESVVCLKFLSHSNTERALKKSFSKVSEFNAEFRHLE